VQSQAPGLPDSWNKQERTYDLLHGLELEYRLDRSKDLLPRNLHVVRYPGEDGRLEEEALFARPLATKLHLGALAHAAVDKRQDLLELGRVDLRTKAIIIGNKFKYNL
jgi:hypothetical protein